MRLTHAPLAYPGEAIPSSAIVLAVEAAAHHGHARIVRFLLDFGRPASADEETSSAENQKEKKKEKKALIGALHEAAKVGNTDSVLALLRAVVDIKQDPRLVEAAVTSGNLTLVRTLVEAGAMVNPPAGHGLGHDFKDCSSI
jgi:ankyrin repeat protein